MNEQERRWLDPFYKLLALILPTREPPWTIPQHDTETLFRLVEISPGSYTMISETTKRNKN